MIARGMSGETKWCQGSQAMRARTNHTVISGFNNAMLGDHMLADNLMA